MKTAFNMLPNRFEDGRHEKITAGLQRYGYNIKPCAGMCDPRDDRDILVTWTVHRGPKENAARAFEAKGGRVIVCEESPLKGIINEKMFSLSLHDHNGAGTWNPPENDISRWVNFGLKLHPWRDQSHGDYILVAGQRGIGSTEMGSPTAWHNTVEKRLTSSFPIKVRPHPKSRQGPLPETTLDEDLARARAVVIWSSGVGTKALLEGTPVFYDAPHFFLEDCSNRLGSKPLGDPDYPERLPVFGRFAWSQWFVPEIESGAAFERLLA